MNSHSRDHDVFVRSLASRGALGGLSEAAKRVLYLFKAYGFDIIIIETVGVGQDEIDIAAFADITTVLVAPGAGDIVQMNKAGIMEIADLFIVNKSDLPEADTTRKQINRSLQSLPETHRPPIISTIAETGSGIDEVAATIEKTDCFISVSFMILEGHRTSHY